jgi:hypothetical protein
MAEVEFYPVNACSVSSVLSKIFSRSKKSRSAAIRLPSSVFFDSLLDVIAQSITKQQDKGVHTMKFIDLLKVSDGDICIRHAEYFDEYPTLEQPNLAKFTEFALERFKSVLDAEVTKVAVDLSQAIEVTLSVSPQDILDFINAYIGNISQEEYAQLWEGETDALQGYD